MSDDLFSPDTARLEQYLAGEVPPDESEQIAEWIGADPVRQTMALGLKSLDQTRADRSAAPDIDALWGRVRAHSTVSAPGERKRPPARIPVRAVRFGMAAVAVAVIAVFTAGLWPERGDVSPTTDVAGEYHEYTTAPGQVATVNLGDGTRVTLAPGSALRYSRSFGARGRDVHLRGEAYFDVAHRPTQPFVVFTETSSTQVLGTQFSVRQYVDDTTVAVGVVTGKVAVMARLSRDMEAAQESSDLAERNAMIVSGGEEATLISGRIVLTQIAAVTPTWTTGKLAYTNAPLRVIAADLQRWYGVTIIFDNARTAERRLTATFSDPTLTSEALAGIATPLGLGYKRDETTITFHER